MPEPQARARERGAGVHGALEKRPPSVGIAAVSEDEREIVGDERRPGERLRVGLVVLPLNVQRLGAVRECVQGRSAGLAGRHVVRELRLVDDARDVCSRAAALHAAGLVADPETARPFGPGVRRGYGDDGRPVAAETALAVSIALPPPTASKPSAPPVAAVASATDSGEPCDSTP